MIRNFVCETVNNPGTSATLNLLGATAGCVTFASQFATGAACFYYITDGTIAEAGQGTFTSGSPNTVSRTTVLWNTSGTTSRLNFTGSAQVYNDVPAERVVYADANQNVGLNGYLGMSLPAIPSAAGSLQYALIGSTTDTNGDQLQAYFYRGSTGTTYSTVQVQIRRLVDATAMGTISFDPDGYLRFYGGNNSSSPMAIGPDGRFVTSGPGNSSINFTSGNGLTVQQTGASAASAFVASLSNTSSLFAAFTYNGSFVGSISTNGSSTFYNTTSDYRLKVLHGEAEPEVGALLDAVPVYMAEMHHGGPRPMFLAHELQACVPDAVRGEKDAVDPDGAPIFQTVDHSALVPILWAELRDMRRRLAAAEGIIATLTAGSP